MLCPLHFQYGVSLYDNYKTAEKKAAVNTVWTNRSTPSSSNPSTPTLKGSAQHKLLTDVKQHRCNSYTHILCVNVNTWCFSVFAAKSPSQANGHAPKPGPISRVQSSFITLYVIRKKDRFLSVLCTEQNINSSNELFRFLAYVFHNN